MQQLDSTKKTDSEIAFVTEDSTHIRGIDYVVIMVNMHLLFRYRCQIARALLICTTSSLLLPNAFKSFAGRPNYAFSFPSLLPEAFGIVYPPLLGTCLDLFFVFAGVAGTSPHTKRLTVAFTPSQVTGFHDLRNRLTTNSSAHAG